MRFHTAVNKFCLNASLRKDITVYKTALHQYRPYLSIKDAFKVFKFTIDNNLPGRDNKFALLPEDMRRLCQFRDNFSDMNKYHGLDLQKNEYDIFNNYRGRWSKH